MQPVTDPTNVLVDLLGFTARQHEVVSQNIANVNTPGFKTLSLSFPDPWEAAAKGSGLVGDLDARLQLEEEPDLAQRQDGNNVDIERELGRLGKNAVLHQTLTELLAAQFDAYRRAIQIR